MTDQDLKRILGSVRTVACLGVSTNPVRPSYFVARYLGLKGYDVWPVNPVHAGKELLGKRVVGSLEEVPVQVDMLDVFRRSEHVPGIVDDALANLPGLKVIWLQIGISHDAAAEKARAHCIEVVQNRCPKIENQRLFGELRMGGFATGIISSRM